ncbi:hypothetical protein AURDEDRAFT_158146 [Auricularia subglabra TFB-10046 SS5]|nr:hypothetical protein AURDEDRAFT_158146 [Auricularia subglabra TFB-10046 SS5]
MDFYVDLVRASAFLGKKKWDALADLAKANNKDIKNALDALVKIARDEQKESGLLERAYYGPTVKLCNFISLAVFDALGLVPDTDAACIFASNANCCPKGDILNIRFRPDYHAFFASRNELVVATGVELYNRMVCWPEMWLVGEQKKLGSGEVQIKSYVSTDKRYRPDLPTVHGFIVHRGKLQLSQLNASGMWSSSPLDIDDINAWIALVVLAYQSFEHRDRKLIYNAQQEEFGRWDFTDVAAPDPTDGDDATDASAGPSHEPLVLAPFYAANAPGRVTFASYEVASGPLSTDDAAKAFREGEVRGFWKMSWQQKGRSHELDLLDRLHSGGWLPGLVRPYEDTCGDRLFVPAPTDIIRHAHTEAAKRKADQGEGSGTDVEGALPSRDVDTATEPMICGEESGSSSGYRSARTSSDGYEDEDDGDDDASGVESEDADETAFPPALPNDPPSFVERFQEILHLASIGEPLSQCSTPRELLEVIYDLLEVHIHMWDEGVLHRDVSWFNVMCKPKHYTRGDAYLKSRPCIRKILHGLTDNPPAADLVPTVLLADLDHAIEKDCLKNDTDTSPERTGTPMFISYELSNYRALEYPVLSLTFWDVIREHLILVETHAHGPEILRRAFPDDDGQFMAAFDRVRKQESTRSGLARLSGRPIHKPRHDAESIYWILLWALGRARPRGSAPETDETRLKNLSTFGVTLLEHNVGDESDRIKYMDPNSLRDLLHPELAPFEELLRAMASYLVIQWHLYPELNDNHVHIAFQRMIFGYLLCKKPDKVKLDLALDTEKPRRLVLKKGKTAERKTSPWSGSLFSVGASGRANILDMLPQIQHKSPAAKGDGDVVATGSTQASTRPGSRLSSAHGPHDESLASVSSTGSKKRKAVPAAVQPPKKRTKTGASSSGGSRAVLSAAERAWKASKYTHSLHHTSRTAHALRLKVWNDRNRWFTKGE